MCGRFTMTAPARAVKKLFPLFDAPELPPRYNVAPTQPVLAVRAGADGGQELVRLRWGLVPSWAQDPSIGNRMINARSETVPEKPAFRAAFKRRRCLILADGFYEWQATGAKHKHPYYFRVRDSGLFAFAGLWERWAKGGEPVESCAIITTAANELVAPVHDRMPVILPREKYDHWLDRETREVEQLLRPFPAEAMTAHPVSAHVNSPRNDDPGCVRPLPV